MVDETQPDEKGEQPDGWSYQTFKENMDALEGHEPPTYYVGGEEVQVRGISFEPEEARGGGGYILWHAHVQFPESEKTRRVHPSQLSVAGGAEAMYEDFVARGLMPEWIPKNNAPPWEREDAPDDPEEPLY
jgi:hypothetical protein